MKNSVVRIIIGLMTLGLLASCTAKPTDTPAQKADQTSTTVSNVPAKIQSLDKFQSCIKTSTKACEEESTKSQARETNDISWCDLLDDTNAKKSCQTSVIYSNAITKQDENICKDLADDTMKSMCRSQIISQKASKAQDIALCDTIATSSSGAIGTMTGVITATGSNTNTTNDIERNNTRNSEMCRMRVIQSMNIMNTDAKACDKMKTEEGKENCQSFIKTMKEREKDMNG